MAKSPTTTTAPTGNIAPFGLRMLPELKERIEAAAKASGRSMNAEITDRLERSFVDGPDFAMVLADAQYQAALQALDIESMRIHFVSLASLVEILVSKSDEVLAALSPGEQALFKDAMAYAKAERENSKPFEEAVDRVGATRELVREARMRFLEAKGAKGVRDAKV
ncbi:Arc family DNA-binding protein [Variovorax sp. R-27]|uniref:Arc family DNA-binding protein n=1 Tax=Variovorax sp. R-27 TaxID=3404058 RepID=UPI003CEDECBD